MFFYTRGKYNRPELKLEIYRVDSKYKKQVWEVFRKYHYLNTDLHQAAAQYVGIIDNQLVCHTGVIQFPLRKGWKRVHRLVVLPDYQGIGIGTAFINRIAEVYQKNGFEFNLTTTTPSLIHALCKNKHWVLKRYGRASSAKGWDRYKYTQNKNLSNSSSEKRITYSFNYK